MSFAQDAGLFPHQIDIAADRVLLVSMREQDYRDASFLDNRLLSQRLPMEWREWGQLAQLGSQLSPDAQFIFHIGHVGSTLISRLLGEAGNVLSLREPQILRQLAELHSLDGQAHSPWPPGRVSKRLPTVLAWLSRGFAPGQTSLVKATSFVSEVAPDILAGERKAIFLTLRPERYIQAILAGENSRRELAALSSGRMQRLHARLGETPLKLWELDEARRAGMAWVTEMTALERATGTNVLWADFDVFLSDPVAGLVEMAQFLGIGLDTDRAAQLVSGPIMQQYSKAPEHGYSTQLREETLAQAARQRGQEIAAALEWLDKLGKGFPSVSRALDRASGDQ